MSRDEQTFAIIGAAMEVHRELQNGFFDEFRRKKLGASTSSS